MDISHLSWTVIRELSSQPLPLRPSYTFYERQFMAHDNESATERIRSEQGKMLTPSHPTFHRCKFISFLPLLLPFRTLVHGATLLRLHFHVFHDLLVSSTSCITAQSSVGETPIRSKMVLSSVSRIGLWTELTLHPTEHSVTREAKIYSQANIRYVFPVYLVRLLLARVGGQITNILTTGAAVRD